MSRGGSPRPRPSPVSSTCCAPRGVPAEAGSFGPAVTAWEKANTGAESRPSLRLKIEEEQGGFGCWCGG